MICERLSPEITVEYDAAKRSIKFVGGTILDQTAWLNLVDFMERMECNISCQNGSPASEPPARHVIDDQPAKRLETRPREEVARQEEGTA